MSEQSTWEEFTGVDPWGADAPEKPVEDEEPEQDVTPSEEEERSPELPPEATEPCPWCYAPPTTFHAHEDGRVGCTLCSAVIPIHTEWYQAGEKVSHPKAAKSLRG